MDLVPPSDLEAVLEELDLDLGRSTEDEVWARCPGHKDRLGKEDSKPTNFSVNRNTGWGYCFACGYQTNLLRLVCDLLDLDLWEGSRWLRENGASLSEAIERVGKSKEEKKSKVQRLANPKVEAEFAIFTDPPQRAIERRGYTREAVDFYTVRWEPELKKWIIPIRQPDGELMGWQMRIKPKPVNYPPYMRKKNTLFGAYEFNSDMAVLVESPLDVVKLKSVGFEGGLSSIGVEISWHQMDLIIERAKILVLALDNDDAGWKKTWQIVGKFGRRLPIRVMTYDEAPHVKDIGDMTSTEMVYSIEGAQHAALVKKNVRR